MDSHLRLDLCRRPQVTFRSPHPSVRSEIFKAIRDPYSDANSKKMPIAQSKFEPSEPINDAIDKCETQALL